MATTDTYSPKELKELLDELELKGLKIAKVESPSIVYDSIRKERLDEDTKKYRMIHKDVEVDESIIFTFETGRKIGIDFFSASHVFVSLFKVTYEMEDVSYKEGDITVSDIFPELIGKTIKDYFISTTKNYKEIRESDSWEDKGFNENQDEFITKLEFIFTDNTHASFECDIDYMLFSYDC